MQLPPGGIVNDNAVAESLDSCNALWFASQFHTRCFRRGRALTQPINEGERLLSKVGLVAQPRWIDQDGQHAVDDGAGAVTAFGGGDDGVGDMDFFDDKSF